MSYKLSFSTDHVERGPYLKLTYSSSTMFEQTTHFDAIEDSSSNMQLGVPLDANTYIVF